VKNETVSGPLILFLPIDPGGAIGWARIADGVIVGAGDAFVEDEVALDKNAAECVAVVPAMQTGIDWISLPDLPQAQRDAAARELMADAMIGGAQALHVVTGLAENEFGLRPVAWVEEAIVDNWLARLAELGLEVTALIPAQLALADPGQGLVEATLGSELIIRGPQVAWLSDSILNDALSGGVKPTPLTERQRDAGLLKMLDCPPLNLIAGRFAPKRSWALGFGNGRRLALLAAALVGLSLFIPHAQNWQLNRAAARLEAETSAAAAILYPESGDPAAQLRATITARRGGGAGFLPTLNAVIAAVSSTTNVELTGLRFFVDGTLETTIRATNAAESAEVRRKIEASGFVVETGVETMNQGRLLQSIKVRGS
jgi:general secretion pathway protein L